MAPSTSRDFLEAFVVMVAALSFVSIQITAKDDDLLEQPQFSFVETDDVVVKYSRSTEQGVKRYLYVCCLGNKKVPPFIARLLCKRHSKCPVYEEVESCRTQGAVVLCDISYVMTNTTLMGYLTQSDLKNITVKSKVATYVTSDSTKTPRPVANLKISPKGSGLHLSWTPSTVYFSGQEYSQLVSCRPVQEQNAKALRQYVDFDKSSFTVQSSNISALTKYKCCIQVENEVTSTFSEPTCATTQSPEQAPSSPPVITCGNLTHPCAYVLSGSERNTTITFELPKPNDRNGKIIHSLVTYHNTSSSNKSTTPEVIVVNGSATSLTLPLRKDVGWLISARSCTVNGCSPSSNTVQINAIPLDENHTYPMATVLGIVITGVVLIILLLAMGLWVRRRIRNAKRGKMPDLDPTLYIDYDNPTDDSTTIYNKLDELQPAPSISSADRPPSISSADNLAVSLGDET